MLLLLLSASALLQPVLRTPRAAARSRRPICQFYFPHEPDSEPSETSEPRNYEVYNFAAPRHLRYSHRGSRPRSFAPRTS